MSVESKHPLYSEFIEDWVTLRDCYRGERVIKRKGPIYLPMTSGMIADGAEASPNSDGAKAFLAYVKRAVFPDLVREGIEAAVGIMHSKPPTIELPEALEPMREKATLRNESLEALLRRINEEQLITGRVGLLLEFPTRAPGEESTPYIALYKAEHIINWDEGVQDQNGQDSLNLVVIDETAPERTDEFTWEEVNKYRVLVLGDVVENEPQGEGVYRVGVFREGESYSEAALTTPNVRGSASPRIPFVFANSKDVVAEPDDAPLVGLANLSLAIYRAEADHRQALFMQGQDTLVEIGAVKGEETTRLGAGSKISLPMGGDAKFIGVDSAGLPSMQASLDKDYSRGKEKASTLLEAVSRSAESGEALRVRVSARTASLNQIALSGAFALQEVLRIAAEWLGLDPETVVVSPNLDFVNDTLEGRQAVDYMTAKGLGLPLSLQSIHETLQARGLTSKTWEEELEQMEAEGALGLPGAVAPGADDGSGSTDPNGPGPNVDEDEDDPDEEDDEGEDEEDDETEGGDDAAAG